MAAYLKIHLYNIICVPVAILGWGGGLYHEKEQHNALDWNKKRI